MKYLFSIIWLLVAFSACRKDDFITGSDATLKTGIDTLRFDTVFAATGSVTKTFTITNTNNKRLNISSIKLMGGTASAFKINVNGIPGPEITAYELLPNDSLYVFVTVQINPTQANLPFVISDSVQINYNGNTAKVQLQAFGQNAVFLRNAKVSGNTNWVNDKPYVILGRLTVDTNAVLNIPQGTKVYVHADAPIIVHGTLNISGTVDRPVVFSGDRIDEPYRYFPAAWPGIYLSPVSKNNRFTFTQLRNSYQALVIDGPSPNGNPKLFMQQCIIDNAYDVGIFGNHTSIDANNSLISNCKRNLHLQAGGSYGFTNCTFAAYSNYYVQHNEPSVFLLNYDPFSSSSSSSNPMSTTFTNCIIWGDNDNELYASKQGSATYEVLLKNSIYKSVSAGSITFLNALQNQDPRFDSIDVQRRYYNFRTNNSPIAPGINKGVSTAFTKDLDDAVRANGITDIGAYERQ